MMDTQEKTVENPTATRDFVPSAMGVDKEAASLHSADIANLEDAELGPRATYINTGAAAGLSQEHRDYLIQRHGTLDLDPIPSADPADPYNWPSWKVSSPAKTLSHLCKSNVLTLLEKRQSVHGSLDVTHDHFHRRCHHSSL